MDTVVLVNPMTPIPAPSQQPRPVLRRATYVHVSDLTSAYNIDHAKLEQELSRVKAAREAASLPSKTSELGETDGKGASSDIEPSLASSPPKRLQPPRGGYNLCILVGKVTVVVDKRRVDQSRVRLAEVEIGDETGTVSLRARDDQIDVLSEVSKRSGAVVLRNCTLELYQGKHIRLAVTKWGKLTLYPDTVASTPPPPSKMNDDRNFSLIDLSVVASEMVDPQPETSYSTRPAKPSEPSEVGGRSMPSKSGGPSHSKHQQSQSSQRRNSRDRRQPRGKTGGSGVGLQSHYGPQGDVGALQSPTGQMRYHQMPAFPAYDQGMDPRQYSYSHGRQQEQVIPPASAQQLMLQRQYHMQQMYHSQQDRHRTAMGQGHQVQGPGMILPVVTSGSFDASGEYPVPSYATPGSDQRQRVHHQQVQHQQVMPVGSSPILIPMPMGGGRGSAGISPVAAGRGDRIPDLPGSQADRDTHTQYMSVSPDDSQFSAKMNPEATAFAPSYMGPQANPPRAHQAYFPFHPSQSPAGAAYQPTPHHTNVYTQGMMYVPAAQTTSKPPPGTTATAPAASAPGNIPSSTQASGKENLQSP